MFRSRFLALMSVLLLGTGCGVTDREDPGRSAAPAETPASATPGRRAPIEVEVPAPGDELTPPVTISGTANVFEATVSYRVVDETGRELAAGFTTATCGTGCRGEFSATADFEVAEPTEATIEVFESSAKDGSPLHLVEIPVRLVPDD